MSTKTSFKRIALVAVSALGFGLLSVVPASATVPATAVPTATSATISVGVGEVASTTIKMSSADSVSHAWTLTAALVANSKPVGSTATADTVANGDASGKFVLSSVGATAPFYVSGTTAASGKAVVSHTSAGVITVTGNAAGDQASTDSIVGTFSYTPDKPGIYKFSLTSNATTPGVGYVTVYAGYSADSLRANRAFPTQGSNVTSGWTATAGGLASIRFTNFADATRYYVTIDTGSIITATGSDNTGRTGTLANTNGINLSGGVNFLTASPTVSDYVDIAVTDLGAATTTVTVKSFNASTGAATTFAAATVTWGVAAAASTQYSLCTLNAGAGTTATGSAADTLSTSVSKAVAAAKNFTIQVVVKDQYNAALNAKTIAAVITGPGLIGIADGNAAGAATGRAVSQLLTNNAGSVSVWADGSTGTSTITISVGTTTLCSKTVTFVGSPTTATATQNLHIAKKGTTLGATPSTTDGTNDGTTYLLTPAFTVNVTDADGNDVMAGSTVKMVSSDTSVITVGTCAENSTYSGNFECSVAGAVGAATGASATVTFYVYNAATAAYDIATDALTFKIGSGTIGTETMTLDAASYDPGAAMVLTMKAVDAAGNPVADGTASRVPTANKSVVGLPTAAKWYVNGERVYKTSLYAPATEGSFTVKATSGNAAADTVSVSANVNGGASAAAAEAASDAALEAIDAANAATDAANLAAEAADAATVAAEEARDAADAATAAVEALASEVATLMAALKAQLTTLAKTVAKIAKKVKA